MHPQALYKMCNNDHSFIAKVDSGASRNCISKSLWNRIKVNSKLAKPNVVLTEAGGSKLSLLGFAEITCLIGKFTFTEEFAVIDGMVSHMLLGIKWEHKFNIHTGWTQHGNHYISRGKHNFIAESITSSKYESIAKGSLLGTFEPIDEEISEIQVTSWTDLEGKMQKAHQQLRKKRSYRQARQKCFDRKKETLELLPDYPENSNVEMEGIMKRPDTKLVDATNADKWKTKVLNMLESRFSSIISRSSTDVGRTKLHTLDIQVMEGSPVFMKQYTILLKYQKFIDDETKRLEEAGLISKSLSNWSAPVW